MVSDLTWVPQTYDFIGRNIKITEVGKDKPKIILFPVFVPISISLFPFRIHVFVLGSAFNCLLQVMLTKVRSIPRATEPAVDSSTAVQPFTRC